MKKLGEFCAKNVLIDTNDTKIYEAAKRWFDNHNQSLWSIIKKRLNKLKDKK